MCIAAAGIVVKKAGHKAIVDFDGNKVEAEAGLTECETGDRVLVHAGCIIQRLTDDEAQEINEIMRLIDEV